MPSHLALAPLNGRVALITGVTGQDGSYLAELLLAKGYRVWGMTHRSANANTIHIAHLLSGSIQDPNRFQMISGDLRDSSSLVNVLKNVQPDELYHLGAQSHIQASFEDPELTGDVTGLGAIRLLEAVRKLGLPTRFFAASSSEIFGKDAESPQTEKTPFHPSNPYGIAKVYAFHATVHYRECHGLFAVNGILYNHESPRRNETFVTRKITRAIGRILAGQQRFVSLGNLEACRDWGFAGDYVEGMWRMLQAKSPEDYILASGTTHTLREFCQLAFQHVGLPMTWHGQGLDETGIAPDGRTILKIDPRYFRPGEMHAPCGDAAKARQKLGWNPTVTFEELVRMMVDHDLALARDERGDESGKMS